MGTSGEDAVDEAFRIERGEVIRAFAEADELDGLASRPMISTIVTLLTA